MFMAKDMAPSIQFEEAKKLIKKGIDGDKRAVKEAYEKFKKLRADEPGNALVEAYYGSCLTLLARDAVQPLDKAEKAQTGLDALDRAVSMDPNQKRIRLLRANVCVRLPEVYFQSSNTAIKDFTYLLERYQEDSDYLSKKQVVEILRNLVKAYQNAGKPAEAAAVLKRLAKFERKK
jgi:lipopolysaccharide biosynthesis regulator YciM